MLLYSNLGDRVKPCLRENKTKQNNFFSDCPKNTAYWLGEVALACNPAEVGRSQGQEIETNLANTVKPYLY